MTRVGLPLAIVVGLLASSTLVGRGQPRIDCTVNEECPDGFTCPHPSSCCGEVGYCVADGVATPTPCPCAPPSATPFSATPTSSHSTFRIDGCVVHFSGCGGSMEFGAVHLSPLDRIAHAEGGYFSFEDVPPGDYSLTYSPRCNPAGCTGTVHVRIVDADGYAAFRRSDCVADCSINSVVTVDEVLVCVSMALDGTAGCPLCDTDGDGQVTVDELTQAVGALLNGCR